MTTSPNPQTEPGDAWGPAQEQEASVLIECALAEDLPAGDITSDSLFPSGPDALAGGGAVVGVGVLARCVFRQEGVFCGAPVAEALLAKVDPAVKVKVLAVDDRGKVRLSMKVVDQTTGKEIKEEPKRE